MTALIVFSCTYKSDNLLSVATITNSAAACYFLANKECKLPRALVHMGSHGNHHGQEEIVLIAMMVKSGEEKAMNCN